MDLLKEAMKAPKPEAWERRGKWKHVVPVIKVLRDKGYTNKQVGIWLTQKGFKCTVSDVAQAYIRYIKNV